MRLIEVKKYQYIFIYMKSVNKDKTKIYDNRFYRGNNKQI